MKSKKYIPRSAAFVCLIAVLLTAQATSPQASDRTPSSIGLALGSGGAAGLSHIAMLEVFDETGLKPHKIAGSSIGAIIGSLYASGLSGKEIRSLFQTFSGDNITILMNLIKGESGLSLGDLMQVDLENGGVLDSEDLMAFLIEKMGVQTFEKLQIPLMVIATDYRTGEERIFEKGDLAPALKASMAVPGLFSPEPLGESLFIDGGISNPLPYDVLTDTCDMVVAIDVAGPGKNQIKNEINSMDVLFDTFGIMQRSITAAKMKYKQPQVYIKPDVLDIRLLEFHRMDNILEQSRPAAEELRKKLLEFTRKASGQN